MGREKDDCGRVREDQGGRKGGEEGGTGAWGKNSRGGDD